MKNPGYAALVQETNIVIVVGERTHYIDGTERPATYEAVVNALHQEAPFTTIQRLAEIE